MPRPYHSASSIKLAQRCEYAYALQYIAGLREPEITWEQIEAGAPHEPRQRSTALGKYGHTVLENWYLAKPPDWASFPGQVMLSGAHLLPHPERVEWVGVERPIGNVPIDNPNADGPQSVIVIDGVKWAGFRDLLARPLPAEAKRLGLPVGTTLIDYKTSADIGRYALTAAELHEDVQANLYAYATALEHGTAETHARWVYFETKRVRRAKAVDVAISRENALRVLEPCNTLARQLDSLADVKAATKNPHACGDYGGCRHHVTRGGTCDARRSLGGLIQARVKKELPNMAINPDLKKKFDGLKKAPAAAVEPEAEPEADEGDAEQGESEIESEGPEENNTPEPEEKPAPAAAKPKLVKPTPATAPAAAAKPAPAPKASKLAALVSKLETKQAECDAIKAEIREAL